MFDKVLIPEDEIPTLSTPLQNEIIDWFWPHNSGNNSPRQEAYFSYFRSELDAWRLSGSCVAIKTYHELLRLVKHLRSTSNKRRDSYAVSRFFQQPRRREAAVQSIGHNSTSIDNALDLAVRLWLMLNVGCDSPALYPGRSRLVWEKAETLNEFVHKCFPRRTNVAGPNIEKAENTVPTGLNVYNLEHIGGFDIVWTDHLADHLCFNDDLGTISVFHHTGVLQMSLSPDNILPRGLLEETIRSLALLLPRANTECKEWYQKCLKRYPNLDPKAADLAMTPKDRKLEDYHFWRERLETIVEAYDSSEPKALPQWWNDRRNKVQWYTFWTAVLILLLTIVFGLIQSITGILQVYYASRRPS